MSGTLNGTITAWWRRHGRRAVLAIKVFTVGAAIGGLWSSLLILILADKPPAWMERFFAWAVLAPLLVAAASGVVLLLNHPGVYVRLRWWRVMLLFGLISLVFSAEAWRTIDANPARSAALGGLGLGALLMATVAGRLKPRFGQDPVRTAEALRFAMRRPAGERPRPLRERATPTVPESGEESRSITRRVS